MAPTPSLPSRSPTRFARIPFKFKTLRNPDAEEHTTPGVSKTTYEWSKSFGNKTGLQCPVTRCEEDSYIQSWEVQYETACNTGIAQVLARCSNGKYLAPCGKKMSKVPVKWVNIFGKSKNQGAFFDTNLRFNQNNMLINFENHGYNHSTTKCDKGKNGLPIWQDKLGIHFTCPPGWRIVGMSGNMYLYRTLHYKNVRAIVPGLCVSGRPCQ
jgi:hypothetical protein